MANEEWPCIYAMFADVNYQIACFEIEAL